jgi:hypothetical protein
LKIDFKKITKLILAGKLKEASELLTQYTFPLQVQLITEPQATPYTGVLWSAKSPNLCSFTLNSSLPKDRVQFFTTRLALTLPIIMGFHQSHYFTAGTIFLNLDDSADAEGIAFCSNRDDSLLIPDAEFLETGGYSAVRKHFQANVIPWQQRLGIAFWRGSTTGVRVDSSWGSIPRIKMCEICNAVDDPSLFDVGVTGLAQISKNEINEIRNSDLIRNYFPIAESNRYKYQIDIDGNTNAWAGLFQKLLSGSAVLKVESPYGFRQWYYDKLVPWEHYVPVKSDMSDLVENVRWLIGNDDEARRIGQIGANLARDLSYELVIDESLRAIQQQLLKKSVDL